MARAQRRRRAQQSEEGRRGPGCCWQAAIFLLALLLMRDTWLPVIFMAQLTAWRRPTEPNFDHTGILSSRLQIPPWRNVANASNGVAWHVGVSTGKMLEDLWRSSKTQQNPPLLAQRFLKRLDHGKFHVEDLGSLCVQVLGNITMYWRRSPAWTSNLNGSDYIYFVEPENIKSSLEVSLEDLVDRWQENRHEGRVDDEVVLLKAFSLVGDFLFTFLHIHPFLDGNGRCSRWMGGWMLSKELGFQVKLPDANETTGAQMSTPRYLMLLTLDQEDASLLTAFLVDCAWSQIQRDA